MILPDIEEFVKKYNSARKWAAESLRPAGFEGYFCLPESVLDEATSRAMNAMERGYSQPTEDEIIHGHIGISQDEWGD